MQKLILDYIALSLIISIIIFGIALVIITFFSFNIFYKIFIIFLILLIWSLNRLGNKYNLWMKQ